MSASLIALTAFIDPSMQARPKDWWFHHASRLEGAYENGISTWYNRAPEQIFLRRELSDLQKSLHWHEIGKKVIEGKIDISRQTCSRIRHKRCR